MRPTLCEIGCGLYEAPPSGENYSDLLAAGERLAFVAITVVVRRKAQPGKHNRSSKKARPTTSGCVRLS
jgi:hypothetical protein